MILNVILLKNMRIVYDIISPILSDSFNKSLQSETFLDVEEFSQIYHRSCKRNNFNFLAPFNANF